MLTWEQVTVDAARPRALARWWAEVLGWVVTIDEDDEQEIRPAPDTVPGVMFVRVDGAKAGKNRLHLDLYPTARDTGLTIEQRVAVVDAKVDELVALGASVRSRTKEDDEDGAYYFVTLADPEGNEFCVIGPQED
jgi:predicted enzyme related to lactoylglutathione lyase